MVGLIFVCSKWQDLFILEVGLNFTSPKGQNLTVGLNIISSNWQDLGILAPNGRTYSYQRQVLLRSPIYLLLFIFHKRARRAQEAQKLAKKSSKKPKKLHFFYRIFAGKMKIFAGKAFAGKKQFLPANIFAVLTPKHYPLYVQALPINLMVQQM